MTDLQGGNTADYWKSAFDERARYHCTVRNMPITLPNGNSRIALVIGKLDRQKREAKDGD